MATKKEKETETKTEMENINFEQALGELEKIVQNLERGAVPLDDSLENFELGIKLVRHCNMLLDNAEKKVKKLTRAQTGEVIEEDFDAE
ncbi:MAG: exodeoxyribonuclease VII small subunit [Oscillospiraceae bacterium]|nr:exodeoxyribonuclease VII small subunit [Oscillospiraceae bacterium]